MSSVNDYSEDDINNAERFLKSVALKIGSASTDANKAVSRRLFDQIVSDISVSNKIRKILLSDKKRFLRIFHCYLIGDSSLKVDTSTKTGLVPNLFFCNKSFVTFGNKIVVDDLLDYLNISTLHSNFDYNLCANLLEHINPRRGSHKQSSISPTILWNFVNGLYAKNPTTIENSEISIGCVWTYAALWSKSHYHFIADSYATIQQMKQVPFFCLGFWALWKNKFSSSSSKRTINPISEEIVLRCIQRSLVSASGLDFVSLEPIHTLCLVLALYCCHKSATIVDIQPFKTALTSYIACTHTGSNLWNTIAPLFQTLESASTTQVSSPSDLTLSGILAWLDRRSGSLIYVDIAWECLMSRVAVMPSHSGEAGTADADEEGEEEREREQEEVDAEAATEIDFVIDTTGQKGSEGGLEDRIVVRGSRSVLDSLTSQPSLESEAEEAMAESPLTEDDSAVVTPSSQADVDVGNAIQEVKPTTKQKRRGGKSAGTASSEYESLLISRDSHETERASEVASEVSVSVGAESVRRSTRAKAKATGEDASVGSESLSSKTGSRKKRKI